MPPVSPKSAPSPRRRRTAAQTTFRWELLPLVAAVVFVVAAVSAAYRETPTVDEYAHVPAGLVHWRHGNLDLYRYNPPLGKLWVALPAALSSSVVVPEYEGNGIGWEPWQYAKRFERENSEHYLALMARARLMTIPLVLACGAVVYFWGRMLYGPLAASLAACLFLLSPTILAHGHLATVDVAATATIAAAAFAVQWYVDRPTWGRAALAGAALGLSLAIKFSALYLALVLPALIVVVSWQPLRRAGRLRYLAAHLALYSLAAWLLLNASFGFAGTFQTVGTLEPQSASLRNLVDRLPAWLPVPLPTAFVSGVDALKADLDNSQFPGYLHGEWSSDGWLRYYPLAFAIKESELVVVLTVISLVTLPVVVRDWRRLAVLLTPPLVLLFIATVLNSLCLGIRYILPVFPFLFVMLGSVFAWIETRILATSAKEQRHHPQRVDRGWFLAVPVLAVALLIPALFHPAYLSYFNQFVGGPSAGSKWLIDSNLDWGQDLYRLPAEARRLDIDRWRLLYFGHVDPSLYGIRFDLPSARPESAVYAVSANYWKGMRYAMLDDGTITYPPRLDWLTALTPTQWAGSIAIFDLRDSQLNELGADSDFNAGVVRLAQGAFAESAARLTRAARHDPRNADVYHYLAMAYLGLKQMPAAVAAMRSAVRLRPDWDVALNNLAWQLATSTDPAVHNAADGVRMAERAVEANGRQELSFLDTLATAYAASGRWDDAIAVCREGIEKAEAEGNTDSAARFRSALSHYQKQELVPLATSQTTTSP